MWIYIFVEGKTEWLNGMKKTSYDILCSSQLFDSVEQKKQYGISGDLAEHYLLGGWKLGYNPSKKFSMLKYLDMYSDIAVRNINHLVHYKLHRGKGDRLFLEDYTDL